MVEHVQQPALDRLSEAAALRRSSVARFLDVLAVESALIITCACIAALWLGYLAVQFAADSWLNLLGGQLIFASGLPHHDALAVMSQGRDWIDQQWLSNVIFYGLYKLGGLTLAARVNVLVFTSAIALCFVLGRRRGASQSTLMLCCIPACLVSLDFMRAQVLVQPLLVALLGVLSAESRRPTARVFLVIPILALWANLHGSVVIAAALVCLLGIIELAKVRRGSSVASHPISRAALLVVLPWGCVFATPYGFKLTAYYGSTIGNPEFSHYLTEWAPPTFPSLWGVPFFALAALAFFLIGRNPRSLTPFELAALGLTLLSGLLAVRSVPWFAYAGALLLPPLLDRELSQRASKPRRTLMSRPLALGGVALSLAVVLMALIRPGAPLAKDWPPAATAAVSKVLKADPSARVFASYDLADWLLFNAPVTRGRIAFDGRWEILEPATFVQIMKYFGQRTPAWERPAQGYRLIVLNPTIQQGLIRTYRGRPGTRILHRSERVIVLDRGPQADPKP